MDNKVSVRWWNHQFALYKAIRMLQNQEAFSDVLIICENRKFEAHKFVLSACSEYFEKQLANMPYRESFYLPAEIKEINFTALLDYMYGGEAIVDEDNVNDLLKAAELLSVRGLAVPFYDEEDSYDDGEEGQDDESDLHCTVQSKLFQRKNLSSKAKIKPLLPSEQEKTLSNSIQDTKNRTSTDLPQELKNSKASQKNVNDMLTVIINGTQNDKQQTTTNPGGRKPRVRCAPLPEESIAQLTCPHCQKKFHWRSNLKKHIRVHTGEKPYICDHCNYKTGYSEALKRHVRKHTGEKPYSCILCDYKCKDNTSLKLHMNKHIGESSYYCSHCPYKTRIKTALDKHYKLVHEIDFSDISMKCAEGNVIDDTHQSTMPTTIMDDLNCIQPHYQSI